MDTYDPISRIADRMGNKKSRSLLGIVMGIKPEHPWKRTIPAVHSSGAFVARQSGIRTCDSGSLDLRTTRHSSSPGIRKNSCADRDQGAARVARTGAARMVPGRPAPVRLALLFRYRRPVGGLQNLDPDPLELACRRQADSGC